MPPFSHGYPFDPSYGYDLARLLAVEPPLPPEGFADWWMGRYRRALGADPAPRLARSPLHDSRFRVFEIAYRSADGFPIRGWLLTPRGRRARRALVAGHGYSGFDGPVFELPLPDAIYLFPCLRGIGLSRRPPISDNPRYHVLHDIHRRDRYILGGCVEDIWAGVGALLALAPRLEGRIGYMGISMGGGVGALAMAWDGRIGRGHLNVPSFGHQALRLTLPTLGSGAAVQGFARKHRNILEILAFYDAASAARFIRQPMHLAVALFDPMVAPPGQFAIYNAIPGEKALFVLPAGHFDYPGREARERQLLTELGDFFDPL